MARRQRLIAEATASSLESTVSAFPVLATSRIRGVGWSRSLDSDGARDPVVGCMSEGPPAWPGDGTSGSREMILEGRTGGGSSWPDSVSSESKFSESWIFGTYRRVVFTIVSSGCDRGSVCSLLRQPSRAYTKMSQMCQGQLAGIAGQHPCGASPPRADVRLRLSLPGDHGSEA